MWKTARIRMAIVYAVLLLACSPQPSRGADLIGYAWPKSNLLIPDTGGVQFKPLQVWRHYDLVKQIDTGYLIQWETTDGSPRLALIPFRDRLTNPTASSSDPPITLISAMGITAQPGFVPLSAGERYPVVVRSNNCCWVVFTLGALTQTVVVAETNVNYLSAGDYTTVVTGVLNQLKVSAERLIASNAEPERVSAVFKSYHGEYASDTAKEREELAMKYAGQAALVRRRVLAAQWAEQDAKDRAADEARRAKGLVAFNGEWVTPAEQQQRSEREARLQAEARKREAEERTRLAVHLANEVAAEAERRAKLPPLEMVGDFEGGTTESGWVHIRGIVRNNTDHEYKFVLVDFNLYDDSSNQVGTASDSIQNLEAGKTWKFDATGMGKSVKEFKFKGFRYW